jgi:farnesyl diphosphate synthase
MADLKSTFLNVYSVLKKELLQDPAFEWSPDSREWVERVVIPFFYLLLKASIFVFFRSGVHLFFLDLIGN